MTVYEQLHTPEVQALRERYHELYGGWVGLHWEGCSTIDTLKEYLRQKIAEKERELERNKDDEAHL